MIEQAWLHNLYRIWYRLYYYPVALRKIKAPKAVEPPAKTYHCHAKISFSLERHESFLYVILPPKTPIYVWRFWKRHFAFSSNNGVNWWELPALTPWNIENQLLTGELVVRYGLNAEFVRQHQNELKQKKLVFIAYD